MRASTPYLLAHLAALAFGCGVSNSATIPQTDAEQARATTRASTSIVLEPTSVPQSASLRHMSFLALGTESQLAGVAGAGLSATRASIRGDANDMSPFGDDVRLELNATEGDTEPGSEDPSRAVEAAKPASPVDPSTMDDQTLAREAEQTHQALLVMLERAGFDTWEHPEFDRALDNPDDLPLPDLLRRRYEILRSVPQYAPADGWISSTFGERPVPGREREQFHKGIDIAATVGTIVYAPGDGVVRFAGRYGSYGNYLSIVHGYGIVTKFAHNEELLVKAGDRVKTGDPIAKVGASGRARGMHLHYEVWVNDRSVDPLGFMPPVPGLSDDPDRLVAHSGEP